MSWGSWLLLAHVVAALWMAAGAFPVPALRVQLRATEEPAARLALLRLSWRLHSLFLVPGLLLAGLLGITLLLPMGYGFRPGWVHLSLTLWVLLVGLSLFVVGPHLRSLLAAAETAATQHEAARELDRLLARRAPFLLADLNALGVLLFTFLMVFRPF